MANPLIKTSFAAGELAPSLHGRVDLAKFQVGAAVMRNFFVDPRGGASTRPGTRHVGQSRIEPTSPVPRIVPFVFSADQAYVLELNGSRMRVIYRGAYVTEVPSDITAAIAQNNDPTRLMLQVPGHGYQTGDWITVRNVVGLVRPAGISGVNDRTFRIEQVQGDNLLLSSISSDEGYTVVDHSTWSVYERGGTVARVHDIITPWAASDLFQLKFVQSADVMTVTYLNYPPYDIKRFAHADWRIEKQTFGTELAAPQDVVAVAQGTGDANTQVFFFPYVVTVVDQNGRESPVSAVASCANKALDQTLTPVRANQISWTGVAGAYKYRVYKGQPVPNGLQTGGPYTYGVVANVFETNYIDINDAPDYTQGPPVARSPFTSSGIASAVIQSAGQGYIAPRAIISDPTGTGAQVTLRAATYEGAAPYGKIDYSQVIAEGANYSSPTVTIVDDAPQGSGLTLAFSGQWVLAPSGSNYVPAPGSITIASGGVNYHGGSYNVLVRARARSTQVAGAVLNIGVDKVVQGTVKSIVWAPPSQGLSTAATGQLDFEVLPDTVVGSGLVLNLSAGGTTNPNCCAYLQQRRVFGGSVADPSTLWLSRPGQFTNFDVSEPTQDNDGIVAGLNAQEVNVICALITAPGGLLALTSGGAYLVSGEGGITPSTLKADPQSFVGCQFDLQPLRVGNQLLYAQSRGSVVAELAYNFYSSTFASQDVSVLSSHLLEGRKIVQWTFASEPHHIMWAVRDDGVMLSLTYLKEQEVYGWARHDTHGQIVSIASVPEGREDAVYLVVRRLVGAGYIYVVERMESRMFGANPASGISADPAAAWCVDGGAAYEPQLQQTTLEVRQAIQRGVLVSATVQWGGSGYVAPQAVVRDDGVVLPGTVNLQVEDGVIVGATVTGIGADHRAPELVIEDAQGSGAVISLGIADLMTFTAGAPYSIDDVGKVLRVRGGVARVLEVSGRDLLCQIMKMPANMANAYYPTMLRAFPGEWSLTRDVSVVGGLDHLNGSMVQILADGSVQAARQVQDGCIALDTPASHVIVGQGFTAQLQTMPLEVQQGGTMQGRKKTIPHVVLRTKDTRGLAVGTTWDDMIEVRDRQFEMLGQPINLQEGGSLMPPVYDNAPRSLEPLRYEDSHVEIQTNWTEDGTICIQQSYPLPATVLALVPFVLPGDTMQ